MKDWPSEYAARCPATGSKEAPPLPSLTDYPKRRRRRMQLNLGCSCLQLLSEQVNHRTGNCHGEASKGFNATGNCESVSRVSDSPGVKLNRKSTNHLGWLAGKRIHLPPLSPDARCWVVVRGERESWVGVPGVVGAESGLNRQSIARRLVHATTGTASQ